MKKLVIAVLGVLLVAPAFAGQWGLGLKLGAGENDPQTLQDAFNAGGRKLDKNPGYLSIEGLYEWALEGEENKLGFKFGLDMYGENELKLITAKATETTYAIPLTLYYKRDNGVQTFSWFGGAGVTFINTTMEVTGESDVDKNKVFPHIVAGGEYRFTELFALGLEARYNFSAKIKKDGNVLSDRSGFGAALTGRFYF